MKEGILNVHLVEGPIANSGNGKQAAHGCEFGYGSKSFSVINSLTLGKSLGDQASFISFNGPIRVVFDFINPFASDGTMSKRQGCDGPCIILFEC